MEKTSLVLFALLFCCFTYLAFQLNFFPLDISKESTLTQPDNTYVKIKGTPNTIQVYPKEINFKINNISVKAKSLSYLKNNSLTAFGKVSRYKNQTYILAEKIEYDN